MNSKILIKALKDEDVIKYGFGLFALLTVIGFFRYFHGENIPFINFIKFASFGLFFPVAFLTVTYRKFKKEQDEYNKRITYAQQPTTAPSYQVTPTPSAEEYRTTPPQPEPTRDRAENVQESPTKPREQAQATQTPPRSEKPTESPPRREYAEHTESNRQTVSQEPTQERQKRKEDIINSTDILGGGVNTETQQEQSQTINKSATENLINDFETLLNAGVFTDQKTGKQPRIFKGADGEYKIIDTDEKGVPLWFKDMIEKAVEEQEHKENVNRQASPEDIKRRSAPTRDRVENVQESPTEPREQAQATQTPPGSEKPAKRTKWGTGGETGTENPKRGRGRPKRSQD